MNLTFCERRIAQNTSAGDETSDIQERTELYQENVPKQTKKKRHYRTISLSVFVAVYGIYVVCVDRPPYRDIKNG